MLRYVFYINIIGDVKYICIAFISFTISTDNVIIGQILLFSEVE